MPPNRQPPIPIGPVRLESRIGRGGMGVVWRGTHERLAQPVAVKILKRSGAAGPTSRRMFRAEARALARLDHPAIVYVYDTGFVPVGANAASGGAITDRAPYLVMEYAPGIPLDRLCGELDWSMARGVLVALLDALAHAHARGVLHLDLKPANVIVELDRGATHLTDFGLARLRDAVARDTGRFEGTPAFMAPEQVECRARLLGPWTDLYALGCLAYALVCGDSPFRRRSAFAMCEAQVSAPTPPLKARCPVPDGLEAWIGRLLSKAPRARFSAAADAASALLRLDPPPTLEVRPFDAQATLDDVRADLTLTSDPPTMMQAEAFDALDSRSGSRSGAPAGIPPVAGAVADGSESVDVRADTDPQWSPRASTGPADEAPPPETTPDATVVDASLGRAPTGSLDALGPSEEQTLLVPTIPSWLEAADSAGPAPPLPDRPPFDEVDRPPPGLGLFGMRTPPLRGRRRARAALWSMLRACAAEGRPQAVVIRGPAGVGKSRLAEWLSETAHTVAGVTTIRVRPSGSPGARDPLAAGFARVLRADGLRGRALENHLKARLGEKAAAHDVEWQAWTALLDGVEMRPADRAVTATWLLRALAGDRPVIMWIDDAHQAGPTLELVERLLTEAQLPVLIACTVDDAAVAERPDIARHVDTLTRLRASVDVDPLPPEVHVELVKSLVMLDDRLADAVAERTAGNPLFAVQLVRDWADGGLLEETPHGVCLRRDARPDRPADIDALWRQRLERVLAGQPAESRVALELAATLGAVVDDVELAAVCHRAGVDPASGMFERLFDARLAYRGSQATDWHFGHGAVRELILADAEAAGRLARHHRHCALVLGTDPRTEWRVARHLVGAGDPVAAVALFERACDRALDRADVLLARRLIADLADALDAARVADDDPRRLRLRLQQARLARHQGDLSRAESEARAVRKVADFLRDRALSALADEEIASGVLVRDPAAAVQMLEAIIADDPPGLSAAARCRVRVMLAYQRLSLRGDAMPLAVDAERHAEAIGRDDLAAMARLTQALAAPDDAEAGTRLTRAEAVFAAAGHRAGLAHCHNLRGEQARKAGDLVVAERFYRSAARLFELSSRSQALYPQLNLALIELERGLYDRAEASIGACAALTEGQDRVRARLVLPVFQAACDAGRGRWQACADQITAAVEAQAGAGLAIEDARRWARFVAEQADAAGQTEIAAHARSLAGG